MRWLTQGCGAKRKRQLTAWLLLFCSPLIAQTFSGQVKAFNETKNPPSGPTNPHSVPTGPPADGSSMPFRDAHYGVRFQVPPGWTFTRKDREVSTFRLDARSAPPASEMRGVAIMGFNPFPKSVLSGALVYFSVARHSNDKACAAEATGSEVDDSDAASIGGMQFLHGHDEHGGICVEARDEVYTAYRKGSCYRFDLAVNTFCAVSSGASELSQEQLRSVEAQMAGILSTVSLDWEKAGPQTVPVPAVTPSTEPKASPRHLIPPVPVHPKSSTGLGD